MSNRISNQSGRPYSKDFLQNKKEDQNTKGSSPFLTQSGSELCGNEVIQKHAQLMSYIGNLDIKIGKLVQHNEAELLFAYKNHLQKVKSQMRDFKEQTVALMQNQAETKQKFQVMEKKLIVFREEALKLYQSGAKKDKIIQLMHIRLEECKSERQFMNQTIKSLLRRNKELETRIQVQKREIKPTKAKMQGEDYFDKIEVNSFASLGMATQKKLTAKKQIIKDRYFRTSTNNTKIFTQSQFKTNSPSKNIGHYQTDDFQVASESKNFATKLKSKLQYIQPQLLNTIVQSAYEIHTYFMDKSYKTLTNTQIGQNDGKSKFNSILRSRSFHTCQSNSKVRQVKYQKNQLKDLQNQAENWRDSELKDCFRKSFQVMKKQIVRRQKLKTNNFFSEACPITLQNFKKIDFLKLIELFFSHQRFSAKVSEYQMILNDSYSFKQEYLQLQIVPIQSLQYFLMNIFQKESSNITNYKTSQHELSTNSSLQSCFDSSNNNAQSTPSFYQKVKTDKFIKVTGKVIKQLKFEQIEQKKQEQQKFSFLQSLGSFCNCIEVERDKKLGINKKRNQMRQNLSNLLKWNDDKEKSLTPIGSLVNLLKD